MSNSYYRMSVWDVLDRFATSKEGLTQAQADERLASYGPNKLADAERKSVWMVFAGQFKDLLVAILAAAAFVSLVIGNAESALVIIAVLILNAVLGTVQHMKAESSLAALKRMSAPVAKVVRGGALSEVPGAQVVPGDIVVLEAGDMVVADGRIIECHALKVNESSLTGESEVVEKTEAMLKADEAVLADRTNMAYSGSLVTHGRATMVVTATGMLTEIGTIADLMNRTQQRKTPLQKSLDQFSKRLAVAVFAVCILVFALAVLRDQASIAESLLFAVALAVAAIPEALGSIVTIVLAMGTQKIAKENAIAKDLAAVESLGSVSVICSDKTGTLTQNKMTVTHAWANAGLRRADDCSPSNPAMRMLMMAALLASDATTDEKTDTELGDPTEIALVNWADAYSLREEDVRREYPRLSELAFDSGRKMMSTVHRYGGEFVMFTKGALDVLLERSVELAQDGGTVPISNPLRAEIMRMNETLSEQGLRVLAFACRAVESERVIHEDERDFTFLGLVAMIDPPRVESAQAVADAKRGGIRTVMITGDHKVTATAIAKSIGIFAEGDRAISGAEVEAMTDAQFDAVLPSTTVYARVSPEHKIRIVDAWQRRGSIVAMTGDGVNDAPALRKADVGVAMGVAGTEVSKDAASIVLADDNFATIVKSIVSGRGIYANIKHAIHFLLSGNMAGILAVLYASVMALPVPFAPVHLLFVNLLTDSLPAIALGMEPVREGLLNQKPRDPKASILDAELGKRVLWHGALIAAASLTAFSYGLNTGGAALGSTMAFATLALARLFHGFNCRGDESIFKLGVGTNVYVPLAWLAGVVLLFAVLFVPVLQGPFAVVSLTAGQVLLVVALSLAPTFIVQMGRAFALLLGRPADADSRRRR